MSAHHFLKTVAKELFAKYGNDMHNLTIVLPSNRAALFVNKFLLQEAGGKPVWSPRYTTSVRLFANVSELQLPDDDTERIDMIWTLYQAYCERLMDADSMPSDEDGTPMTQAVHSIVSTFDNFYLFGETLLKDFDDIDLHLADAKQLFDNISNLEQIRSIDFLSDNQRAAIEHFFHRDTSSELFARFKELWQHLYYIYMSFKERLRQQNRAYKGMMLRELLERVMAFDSGQIPSSPLQAYIGRDIVCVGLEDLSEVERRLFGVLRTVTSVTEHSITHSSYPLASDITFVKAPNPTAQTGYIRQWLNTITIDDQDADTVILLCDEKLLPATLSSIPDEIRPNIAILFSLIQSQSAALVLALLEMQQRASVRRAHHVSYLLPVLRHAYVKGIYPQATADLEIIRKGKRFAFDPQTDRDVLQDDLFIPVSTTADLLQYLKAAMERVGKVLALREVLEIEATFKLYRLFQTLTPIAAYITHLPTMIGLLRRIMTTGRVPYYGEPAEGLQIMAMSDTRALNFRNVLILSCNEGTLPRVAVEESFIPPFLRRAFGLTTIEQKDLQQRRLFTQLFAKADRVACAYNAGAQDTGKAEPSRYLLQMLAHSEGASAQAIKMLSINSNITLEEFFEILPKPKTHADLDKLLQGYTSEYPLSPSAINTYIDCPLKFYYRYVRHLKQPDEVTGELDASSLGSILHDAMQLIYGKPQLVAEEFYKLHLNNGRLTDYCKERVEQAFNKEYFGCSPHGQLSSGCNCQVADTFENRLLGDKPSMPTRHQQLYFNVICAMVERILIYDKCNAPFEIVEMEGDCNTEITLSGGQKLYIGGRIDRIDRVNGQCRVVDYKTSRPPEKYDNDFAKLFNLPAGARHTGSLPPDEHKRNSKSAYLVQIFTYSYILQLERAMRTAPALLFPLGMSNIEEYSPIVQWNNAEVTDFNILYAEFEQALLSKLNELFDITQPFTPCNDDTPCKYCDFRPLCHKQ